jgi:hypothetical protein
MIQVMVEARRRRVGVGRRLLAREEVKMGRRRGRHVSSQVGSNLIRHLKLHQFLV